MTGYCIRVWLLVMLPLVSLAQRSDCSTINFNSGTAAGWILSNGKVIDRNKTTVFYDEVPGTVADGHYITKLSDGNDPFITQSRLPMVAPGSTYSIRIGNRSSGARFDRIRTSLLITPDNAIFQYRFAIVLQDPGHAVYQQPAFRIRVLTENGNQLGCGYYEVASARQIPGFLEQGNLRYRDWTTGAINLQAYIGQTLTIEVTTNDCTEGGHYGYAYFDAQCIKPVIQLTTQCPNGLDSIVISAPEGFENYLWNTGATTPTITVPPKAGDTYSVRIRPFSSLNVNCDFSLDYSVPTLQKPTVRSVTVCEGEGVVVGDTTYQTNGTFTRRIKRSGAACDSIVMITIQVQPLVRFAHSVTICAGTSFTVNQSVYTAAGTYTDRFARLPPLCDSIVTTTLSIRPLVHQAQSATICVGDTYKVGSSAYQQAGIYTDRITRPYPLCDSIVTTTLSLIDPVITLTGGSIYSPGDSIQLHTLVQPPGHYLFLWSSTDSVACSSCAEPWVNPQETTVYKLTISKDDQSCQRSEEVMVVLEKCIVSFPSTFTPNNDGMNDLFRPIAGSCIANINQMTIYSRWGEVIYNRTNFSSNDHTVGWGGTYQDQPVQPGIYTYHVTYTQKNKLVFSRTGSVLLIRN